MMTPRRTRTDLGLLLLGVLGLLLLTPVGEYVGSLFDRDANPDPAASDLRRHDLEAPSARLVGRTADPRSPDAKVPRADVRVEVVGVFRKPLPGVRLKVVEPGIAPRIVVSDDAGSVTIHDVPLDGSATIGLPVPGRALKKPVPIERSPMQVFLWGEFPLQVDLVDAETGRPVPGARWARDGTDDVNAEKQAESGGTLCIGLPLLDQIERRAIDFEVLPPPGYARGDDPHLRVSESWIVRRFHVVFPLRREADIRVTVLDAKGDRVTEGCVLDAHVCGEWIFEPPLTLDEHGRFRVSQVPFYPEVSVTVLAERGEAEFGGASAQMGTVPRHVTTLLVRQGEEAPEDDRANTNRPDLDGVWDEDPRLDSWVELHGGTGRIEVQVLDANGAPMPNAPLKLNRQCIISANEYGRGVFEGLKAGTCIVQLWRENTLPCAEEVILAEGEHVSVTLRELRGGVLDVEVVDADGRPLPFARLHPGLPVGSAWIDVQDGVFRVDPFTDEHGRRHLGRVAPQRHTWYATWGEKIGKGVVTIEEQGRHQLRIVAR